MKSKNKSNEFDFDEVATTLEVDSSVIEGIRSGNVNGIAISIRDDNQNMFLENMQNGMFRLNWSIFEWEEARKGEMFFMLRTGDDKAGIVFNGQFISDPYPQEDWNGSSKRRMYVDMICMNPIDPKKKPRISPAQLQEAIPSIDWQQGHSGTLLSEAEAAKLDELLS